MKRLPSIITRSHCRFFSALPLTQPTRPHSFKTLASISHAKISPEERISVFGWVRSKRKSKNVAFLNINDGSSNDGVQCVVPLSEGSNYADILSRATVGSCVSVTGNLVPSLGSGQTHDINAVELDILGEANSETYPMQKKRHSLEFLRENAHLRGRQQLFQAIARVRNNLTMAVHDFFQKEEFVHLHTPLLTSNDCEGGGEVFQVTPAFSKPSDDQFFKKPAYLTVSSQLHLEMALGGLSRVYTLAPCFRADPGSEESTRHLAEFYMLEAEWAFPCGDSLQKSTDRGLEDLVGTVERLIQHSVSTLSQRSADDLEYLNLETSILRDTQKQSPNACSLSVLERLDILTKQKFERITYDDAFRLLTSDVASRKVKFQTHLKEWGQPLQTEHERYLCRVFGEGKRPVIVTHYPEACKSFYMKRSERISEHGPTVACLDVLIPGIGELVGGSMREDNHDLLVGKLRALASSDPEQQLKHLENFQWYLDLRKYGSCPHGGFGLGFDRLLMYVTGMENIRDVVMTGRWKGKCQF